MKYCAFYAKEEKDTLEKEFTKHLLPVDCSGEEPAGANVPLELNLDPHRPK